MWTPWGPLGDPLGIPWDPLETSWGLLGPLPGLLGDPWEPFGDLWESPGYPLGIFGDVLGFLAEPFATFWGSLQTSFGHFRCILGIFGDNLELQRPLIGSQRGPGRPLGGILRAFWRHRKRLRSDSLQYAKTFKFTVRYCKNRGLGRLKPLKICRTFLKTQEKTQKIRR